MPKHETITLTPNAFTELAVGVEGATIVNTGSWSMEVIPSASGAAPSDRTGAIPLQPGQVILSDILFETIWPGMATGSVWAWTDKAGEAQVSHA